MSKLKIRDDFLPFARPHIDKKEIKLINEVVKSGWWTTGDMVSSFEERLSLYIQEEQAKPIYTLALNSCTSALYISLLALGIKKGDEVIVPTWTFVATAHVVEWTGAKVVFCDVSEDSLNIDIEKAKLLITGRTKAIIIVHFAGYPCDIDAFHQLGEEHGIEIIEDAAHAIGTRYYKKRIGSISDFTCFSFYVTKNLAMAEGGALVSSNPNIISSARKLSYFGIDRDAFSRYKDNKGYLYDIVSLGYKCNMDNINASLGLVQLNKLDKMNKKRRSIARIYKKHLNSNISYFEDDDMHYHVYHLFPVRIPSGIIKRDDFILELKKRNIGSSVHFIPLHMQSYYKAKCNKDDFEVANRVFEEIVSLPIYPSMTTKDIDYVVEHVNDIINLRM